MASISQHAGILIFLVQIFVFQRTSAIIVKFGNTTKANVDLISGLQTALNEEQEQVPTKTGTGVVAIAEKDISKIKLILKSLNEPTGSIGQKCSHKDWTTYMKPAIEGVIAGDKVKATGAYKQFARAVIAKPDLAQKVCLSQTNALQCEPVVERCECLYLEELKVGNAECGGERAFLSAGLVILVGLFKSLIF